MAPKQKKLEADSSFNELDLDGDGVVSDAELAASEALTKHEKADAQRKMAQMNILQFTIGEILITVLVVVIIIMLAMRKT